MLLFRDGAVMKYGGVENDDRVDSVERETVSSGAESGPMGGVGGKVTGLLGMLAVPLLLLPPV